MLGGTGWLIGTTGSASDQRSEGCGFEPRCDKRLQRLQKILCKRVYYFVNVYLNKNHMSETKQNYNGKSSYSAIAFESVTD